MKTTGHRLLGKGFIRNCYTAKVYTPSHPPSNTSLSMDLKVSTDRKKTNHLTLPDLSSNNTTETPGLRLVHRVISQAAKRSFYRGSFSACCWKEKLDQETTHAYCIGGGTQQSVLLEIKSPEAKFRPNGLYS